MKPLIGITPTPSLDEQPHGRFRRYVLNEDYAVAIETAGGVPIVLPPQTEAIEQLLGTIDGLLLSGGADVDPARYGDPAVHPATYGVDEERDRFEFELFHGAVQADRPILGICRGIQVMNVALGGTLVQDVPSEANQPIVHRQQEIGLAADAIGHQVEIVDHPRLPSWMDAGGFGVNSFHHQAIRQLAPSLVPIAFSRDGLVEAVVHPDASFVVGVQWHPELMFRRHPAHLNPFAGLVAAATAARLASVR